MHQIVAISEYYAAAVAKVEEYGPKFYASVVKLTPEQRGMAISVLNDKQLFEVQGWGATIPAELGEVMLASNPYAQEDPPIDFADYDRFYVGIMGHGSRTAQRATFAVAVSDGDKEPVGFTGIQHAISTQEEAFTRAFLEGIRMSKEVSAAMADVRLGVMVDRPATNRLA